MSEAMTGEQLAEIEADMRTVGDRQFAAYAQEAIGRLVQEVRRLREAQRQLLRVCGDVLDELEDRYDGAPDSDTLWMGRHIDAMRGKIAKAEQSHGAAADGRGQERA